MEGDKPTDRDRIEGAVKTCVNDALKAERPFRHINDFLLSLRRAKWSEAEVLEVQTRVLEALKRRRQAEESGTPR